MSEPHTVCHQGWIPRGNTTITSQLRCEILTPPICGRYFQEIKTLTICVFKLQCLLHNGFTIMKTFRMPNVRRVALPPPKVTLISMDILSKPEEGTLNKLDPQSLEYLLLAIKGGYSVETPQHLKDNVEFQKYVELADRRIRMIQEYNGLPDDDGGHTSMDHLVDSIEELEKQMDTLITLIHSVPEVEPPAKLQKTGVLAQLESDMDRIVRSGLQYLYSTVSAIAVKLGDHDTRRYYKWKGVGVSLDDLQSPIVRGASTPAEFIKNNAHLGKPLLKIALETYQEGRQLLFPTAESSASIGVPIPVSVQDEITIMNLLDSIVIPNGSVPAVQTDWVFSVMDDSIFHFLLDASCVAAMGMAVSLIRRIPNCRQFSLKQLIMSEDVRDVFALLTAYQFLLASGGSAYAGSTASAGGKVKGTNLMVSAGLKTRELLSAQVMCAQDWFTQVYAMRNPRKRELETYRDQLQGELSALMADGQVHPRAKLYMDSLRGDIRLQLMRDLRTQRFGGNELTRGSPTRAYFEKRVELETTLGQLDGLLDSILVHMD